tara:strand:- start:2364 stop:3284 length:921 start_codon:yes stop_codon:yes gene_type:complete
MSKTPKGKTGNPEIGMASDSFETVETQKQALSGSDEFFGNLENQVNGSIVDTEATPIQESGPEQVTHVNTEEGSNNVAETQSQGGTNWAKRYKDSSREAVRWRDKYKEVEQFVPVLEAMKKDSGLVQHVREYLVNGGKPAKSVQEELKLDEDFIFDQHEAMTDPDSDSAKLMNAHVDKLVQQRVGSMVKAEKDNASQIQLQKQRQTEEEAFMKRNNMTQADFESFKSKAKNHKMTLDDIGYVLNKDKTAANVAQNTKKDMLQQMKNVRNMPTSASGANSQGTNKTPDRDVFDEILGIGDKTDNLFG